MIFIIYDLEATCWLGRPPGGYNEIIEIGAFKINMFGEVVGKFSRFVKPTVNPILSGFCKKLTKIEQTDVDKAASFPYVIDDFKDWIFEESEDYILGSWGKFDKQLIINDCELHRLEHEWVEPHINVKKQYHTNRKNEKERGLKVSLEKEGLEFSGIEHRAISDAENLSKIFIKYIDEWVY